MMPAATIAAVETATMPAPAMAAVKSTAMATTAMIAAAVEATTAVATTAMGPASAAAMMSAAMMLGIGDRGQGCGRDHQSGGREQGFEGHGIVSRDRAGLTIEPERRFLALAAALFFP
jgi:hypothetical protein